MQIQIRCHGVEAPEGFAQHVERQIYFALGRYLARVRSVSVHLSPGQPAGAGSTECALLVRLIRSESVRVQESGLDIFAALNRAADRAGRAVARRQPDWNPGPPSLV